MKKNNQITVRRIVKEVKDNGGNLRSINFRNILMGLKSFGVKTKEQIERCVIKENFEQIVRDHAKNVLNNMKKIKIKKPVSLSKFEISDKMKKRIGAGVLAAFFVLGYGRVYINSRISENESKTTKTVIYSTIGKSNKEGEKVTVIYNEQGEEIANVLDGTIVVETSDNNKGKLKEVKVIENDGNIIKGYINKNNLEAITEIDDNFNTTYKVVNVNSNLNMRETAEINDDNKIGSLEIIGSSEIVVSDSNDHDWVRVINSEGVIGYVANDYLEEIERDEEDQEQEYLSDSEANDVLENKTEVNEEIIVKESKKETNIDNNSDENKKESNENDSVENAVVSNDNDTVQTESVISSIEDQIKALNESEELIIKKKEELSALKEKVTNEDIKAKIIDAEKELDVLLEKITKYKDALNIVLENRKSLDLNVLQNTIFENRNKLKRLLEKNNLLITNLGVDNFYENSFNKLFDQISENDIEESVNEDSNITEVQLEEIKKDEKLELYLKNTVVNNKGEVLGIDISSSMPPEELGKILRGEIEIPAKFYQKGYGNIDLGSRFSNRRVNYVYISIGASGYVNFREIEKDMERVKKQVEECKKSNTPCGFYYYSTCKTEAEAIMEAEWINERWMEGELPFVIDVEIGSENDRQLGNREEVTKAKIKLAQLLEEKHGEVMLYTCRNANHKLIGINDFHNGLNISSYTWCVAPVNSESQNNWSNYVDDVTEKGVAMTQIVLDKKIGDKGADIDIDSMKSKVFWNFLIKCRTFEKKLQENKEFSIEEIPEIAGLTEQDIIDALEEATKYLELMQYDDNSR